MPRPAATRSQPLNVLFLCQRVPWPPDRGDRITTWHFLQHLLQRGAHIRIGCFSETADDDAAVATLATRVADIEAPRLDRRLRKLTSLRGLLSGKALTLPFFHHRQLAATVERWIAQQPPDLIYVYSSSMAQYAMRCQGPVRLMQFAELDSDKWSQFAQRSRGLAAWIYRREAQRLLAFETEVARRFDISCVVSEVERQLFEQRIPGVVPTVLPNGVDVEHFQSRGDAERHAATLIFTGVMDYEPNVDGVCWFVDTCWQPIRQRFPQTRLLIVGSRPSPKVQQLTRHPGITVTGRVPETPPYFDRSAVAIAPLRLARGVQNKVLEAMSMGLPVVCTPQAAQGLGTGAEGVVVAADAESTIAAIAALLADPARARQQGLAAAAWVREHYRWEHMYAILDRVLAEHGLAHMR